MCMIASYRGEMYATASVHDRWQQQLGGIDQVPDSQAKREQSKRDMKFSPVADDVTVKLFALHGSFYFLQFIDVFLRAGHKGAWTCQFTFLIRNEAVLARLAAQFLGCRFERDIG